jgi:beta-N-acetylhexosaminidase
VVATLKEKVGQMFIVGLQGEALVHEEKAIMERYPFGGFILFSHNCREPAQILCLSQSLWATGKRHPPFISIDQEGGRVHRLPKPFTHFPPAACLGQMGNLNVAYRGARAIAEELALAGINLDFAPVLDVNSNPTNPVIGDRSFAADPQMVIALGERWIHGLRDGGIIPCGKHFPGHGDTDKDSHFALPVVDRPLVELEKVELPPFVSACRNKVESLMTAHVLYRALDPKLPATLSHKIITGLLREKLDYDGVVFSDDMEMRAISDNYGQEETVALCVRAGIDVMLFCHDLSRAIHAFEFLCSEFEKNPTVRTRVETSYKRITKLKAGFLKGFTGIEAGQLLRRLACLNHQRVVDEIHGSL